MNTTEIRLATTADVPHLVLMGGQFFAQTGFTKSGLRCDPFHLHAWLEDAVQATDKVIFVAQQDGALQGVIGAQFAMAYFSPQIIAHELFWWMNPQARKGSAAVRLLRALEEHAKAYGAIGVSMVDIALMQSNAPALYERLGYEMSERTWFKPI